MWKGGARGKRVSPGPWDNQDYEGPYDQDPVPDPESQPPPQYQAVPTPPKPTPPRQTPPVSPPKPAPSPPKPASAPRRDSGKQDQTRQDERKPEYMNGSAGTRHSGKEKSDVDDHEFEFQRKEKRPDTGTNIHRLIKRATVSHIGGNTWTKYLWERKRDLVMAGPVASSKNFKYFMKNKWNSFKISCNELLYSAEIWRFSMKKIEGHQGTGVVSYFVFLRWMFLLNIFIFLIMFWFVAFFQAAFSNGGYGKHITGVDDPTTFSGYANAMMCSSQYTVNTTSDTLTVILDFFQGTGWMEKTALFYGHYTNEALLLSSSYYYMPLAYFLVTVIVLLVSLIVMVYNTISNFKSRVIGSDSVHNLSTCYSVLAAWDFGIADDMPVKTKQKSLHGSLKADLAEQRLERQCRERTMSESCKLYTIRFFMNIIILVMLGGAGASIYYAQAFSSDFTTSKSVKDYHVLVVTVVEFLPSIVIGLLNGIFPLVFEFLAAYEGYKPAFMIKILIVRSVFLRLASLAMILISLYVQITCGSQDSCLVGTGTCPAIQCWETYIGSAMYKLLVMDFLIDIGFTLGIELPRKVITTHCGCWGLSKKIGPAVFDIPKNVLDLVYSQSLVWVGFFFSPLLPALGVLRFFVLFYLKLLSALFNTIPPEKPYNASRSSSFFMAILMIAYFLCCIPVGYTVANMAPSPMCGPFRIYTAPHQIIDIQISLADQWFQSLWDIMTSAAVVAALLILLCLALYYCWALNSAHKGLAALMKEQLILEGKDKQYLLTRIATLTNDTKKRPPPMPKPKTTFINEVKQQNQNNVQTTELKNDLDLGIEQLLYEGRDKVLIPSPSHDSAPPPSNYHPPKHRPSVTYIEPDDPPVYESVYQAQDTRIVLPAPTSDQQPLFEAGDRAQPTRRQLPSVRLTAPGKVTPW